MPFELPNLAAANDKQLAQMFFDLHEEIRKRDKLVNIKKASSTVVWVTAALLHCQIQTTSAPYWLARLPKKRQDAMKKACLHAEVFVRGLGQWTQGQYERMQHMLLSAAESHLTRPRQFGEPPRETESGAVDPEVLILVLGRSEAVFSEQFPDYIGSGWIRILVT